VDADKFTQLVARARADAAFFHDLVFEPERALKDLEFLGARSAQAVRTPDPAAVVALAVGELLTACGGSETCSCTSATCDNTCGGNTCSLTCGSDSCGRTCDDSCGYTTNISAEESVGRPDVWMDRAAAWADPEVVRQGPLSGADIDVLGRGAPSRVVR
jgi:hypothetical protein